ncbi:MAG: kinase [Synergistaceae bacterium]|nr:carbohydrate kinase family protein [Synergistota bacterium]NLM72233.1 kinase [Synergistaceae bacterium]
MNNRTRRVVVVGAANLDILGFTDAVLVARDSNPGRVENRPGGVGRNIAENLARLGVPVSLVTALGDDAGGSAIRASCGLAGVGLEHSLVLPGRSSSVYMAIMDEGGDMALALSDMSILDELTAEHLDECAPLLSGAALAVADACLSEAALARLLDLCPRVFVDPVSVGKCRRMESLLGRFHCVKMNRLEASCLSGVAINSDGGLEEAARRILARGVRKVYITLGAEGAFYASPEECGTVPAVAVSPVNATGAGDAFTAAVVYGELCGWGMERSARFASCASALTLASAGAVSELMSVSAVESVGADLDTKEEQDD